MLALEGQKFVKLEKNFKEDTRENAENVLFMVFNNELEEDITAFDISRVLSKYGDVYVVKDSINTCYVEFQHYDELRLTDCSGAGVDEVR